MRKATLRTHLLGATALLCAACSRRETPVVVGSAPELNDSVTVEVVNDNYYDVRVYAVYGSSTRHALGTIASHHRSEGIGIPWSPRRLSFEVHLVVGFESYVSHDIAVERGDYIQLRVPPNIAHSGSFTRLPSRPSRSTDSAGT